MNNLPQTANTLDASKDKWILTLYVAGQTPKSLKAFANLKKICKNYLEGKYILEIIDVIESPQVGRADQIFAIPTLVRKLPPPLTKIIGDLSNTEKVLIGLNVYPDGGF